MIINKNVEGSLIGIDISNGTALITINKESFIYEIERVDIKLKNNNPIKLCQNKN